MQKIPEDEVIYTNEGFTKIENGSYTVTNGYTPIQFTVAQKANRAQDRKSITTIVINENAISNDRNLEKDEGVVHTISSHDGRYRATSRQYRVSITPADDVLPPYSLLSENPPKYQETSYIKEEDETTEDEKPNRVSKRPTNRKKNDKKCCIIICIIILVLIILIGGILLVVYSAKSILR